MKKSAFVTAKSFKNESVASLVSLCKYYILKKKKENIKNTINGLKYKYYEGTWSIIPDFTLLSEKSSGEIFEIDLDKIERRAVNFAVEFSGYIQIDQGDTYNFILAPMTEVNCI